MLDMKFVRDNLDEVRAMLKNRNNLLSLDEFSELEQRRRTILTETEQLKSQRNSTSKKIGALKKSGEDVTEISAEVRKLGTKISELDNELRDVEKNLRDLLTFPPLTFRLAKTIRKIPKSANGARLRLLILSLKRTGNLAPR